MPPLLDFKNYNVAWIAPLQIENLAARSVLEKCHKGEFPSDRGDDYHYTAGEINGHNVVIASFPLGTQYGEGSAASLASNLKQRFPNLWFGLLVGIAAGFPNFSSVPPLDIRLGDVLVSVYDSDGQDVVQTDFGKQTDLGFQDLSRGAAMTTKVMAAIGVMKSRARFDGHSKTFLDSIPELENMQDHEIGEFPFAYPGQEIDRLYETAVQNDDDSRLPEVIMREHGRMLNEPGYGMARLDPVTL